MTDSTDVLELMQYQILGAVFSRSVRNEVVLKGGFALRAILGSARLTKDIDLQQDGQRYALPRLQRLMRSAIKEALASGLLQQPVVTEPKQTDTVARWKVNGRTQGGSHVHLTIEVSRRGLPPAEHLVCTALSRPGLPRAAMVDSYDANALAASKTQAFLDEFRVAPRDLYDLDILIRMKARPPRAMIRHLQTPAHRERVAEKMDAITYAQFRAEVLPNLPEGEAQRLDAAEFEQMRARVMFALLDWLEEEADAGAAPRAP